MVFAAASCVFVRTGTPLQDTLAMPRASSGFPKGLSAMSWWDRCPCRWSRRDATTPSRLRILARLSGFQRASSLVDSGAARSLLGAVSHAASTVPIVPACHAEEGLKELAVTVSSSGVLEGPCCCYCCCCCFTAGVWFVCLACLARCLWSAPAMRRGIFASPPGVASLVRPVARSDAVLL